MIVELTPIELRHAAHVGIDRYVRNVAKGRKPAHGADHNAWGDHVIGAWGECVIARLSGHYWTDTNCPDEGAPDVGPWHVRTSDWPNAHLIVHKTDRDEGPFVLVIPQRLPRFRVVGWCFGHEGKQDPYWETSTGRPAYFVPQDQLHEWRPL